MAINNGRKGPGAHLKSNCLECKLHHHGCRETCCNWLQQHAQLLFSWRLLSFLFRSSFSLDRVAWCYSKNIENTDVVSFNHISELAIRSAPKSKAIFRLANVKPPPNQRPQAQNAALSTLASSLNQRSVPLATVKPTLKPHRPQRYAAKATPVFSIFFAILCAVVSVAKILPLLPTAQGTLQERPGGVTGP